MAFEKRFARVLPQTLTANGTANGHIFIANTTLFKVKQRVKFKTTLSTTALELEIKKILSATEMVVGPIGGRIDCFEDMTAFTTALGATVEATEQKRQNVPVQEIERFVYCEEPVVAYRVCLVDELGNQYTSDNPLPVDASISVGGISVDLKAKEGDNIAITAHPTQVFRQNEDELTDLTFKEIFSFTPAVNDTKVVHIEVNIETPSIILVKLGGTEIRRRMTSPAERNANFIFEEHRSVANGTPITVEARPFRQHFSSYCTFVALEGYVDDC